MMMAESTGEVGDLGAASMDTAEGICRHCKHRQAGNRQRGLCYVCYGDTDIRKLYPRGNTLPRRKDTPPLPDHRRRLTPFGQLDFEGPVPLPKETTDAVPGSEEKMRVMSERLARRERLFHPGDKRLPRW